MSDQVTTKPGDKYRSLKRPDIYEALRRQGYSKEAAARISNAQARKRRARVKSYTLDEFSAIALKEASGPVAVTLAALYTPALSTMKATQIAPGVSRIRGDLCNVHGRWGSCRAAGYGGAAPPSKRAAPKKLPGAPKPKAGGKRAAGKKGAVARKPIKTEAQREQERQAKRAQAQQQRVAEHEQNKAKVLHDLGVPEDAAGALGDLDRGLPVTDDGGLVKMGLADQGSDGSYRLTSTGRAFLAAAEAGDMGRARDALGRARDQQAGQEERAAASAERKRAADERHAATEAKRAEVARKRAERLAKQGRGKKPPVPRWPRTPAPRSGAPPRVVFGGGGGSRSAPQQPKPKPPKAPELPQPLLDAAQALSEGRELDETTVNLLIRNGLARRNREGELVLTAAGQRATKVTTKAQTSEDRAMFAKMGGGGKGGAGGGGAASGSKLWPKGPDGKRAPGALTETDARNSTEYQRGSSRIVPEGLAPHRLSELKRQADNNIKSAGDMAERTLARHQQRRDEGAPAKTLDGIKNDARRHRIEQQIWKDIKSGHFDDRVKKTTKAFAVFKDASGAWRWISRTTTAFEDRDEEVISTRALEADCARADADLRYGPLRWWHVGRPDPLSAAAPWGPGIDLGWCDFNAVSGRTLIESGTFKTEAIALAVAAKAPDLELSPGFFHAIGEPDASGVFHHIRRFERSLVPKWAGRASNPYTGLVVEKTMDQNKIDALKVLGVPEATVKELIADVERTEKAADADGVRYKEQNWIGDLFSRLVRGEQVAVKEEKQEEATQPAVSGTLVPGTDELAALKAQIETLTTEVAALKAPAMDAEDDPAQGGDSGADEEAEGEPPMDGTGDNGLTLSSEDLAAIGQMFGGVLSSALEPLVGALGITQKLDGHMSELKTLMGGYVKQKEVGDTERANTVAALKATIDQQQAAITESQAKLTELLGDQPHTGYRPTQAADNTAAAVLAAVKDGPPEGGASGPFDDLISNLFPGLAQGGI